MFRQLDGHLQGIKVHKNKITVASSFLLRLYRDLSYGQYIMLKPVTFEYKAVSVLRGRAQFAVSFTAGFFFACVCLLSSPEGMRLVYRVVSDMRYVVGHIGW